MLQLTSTVTYRGRRSAAAEIGDDVSFWFHKVARLLCIEERAAPSAAPERYRRIIGSDRKAVSGRKRE